MTLRDILEAALPTAPPCTVVDGVTYWIDDHIVLGEN